MPGRWIAYSNVMMKAIFHLTGTKGQIGLCLLVDDRRPDFEALTYHQDGSSIHRPSRTTRSINCASMKILQVVGGVSRLVILPIVP